LRAGLRAQTLASPLCDALRFAKNLKVAFEGMWSEYAAPQAA
jgi:predicted O-linked N-acetylglucosamine transferase (SPINDLY family)